jgi:molecular chaperone HscA
MLQIQEPDNIKHIVGIDFGTTNISMAYFDSGEVKCIPLEDNGDIILKSVISFKNGKWIVGKDADKLRSIKTSMGLDTHDLAVPIFEHLLMRSTVGNECIITVPAYFDENARNHVKYSAEKAGWKVHRLVVEPTAAALACNLDDGIYAVYDFGGGTFDISILNKTNDIYEIISTSGDRFLGGDNIDQKIAEKLFLNHLDYKIITKIQKAKEMFEKDSNIKEFTINDKVLKREVFEDSRKEIVDETLLILKNTIEEANLIIKEEYNSNEIKKIILVGGSTRSKYIQDEILNLGYELVISDDPEMLVVKGAAMHANIINSSHLLLDVTPLSLGVEILGGTVEVLIPRNTTIPTVKTCKFTVFKENQTAMKLNIVQGESKYADDCIQLGTIEIPITHDNKNVEVEFFLDVNGLLTVRCISSNKTYECKIIPKNEENTIIDNIKSDYDNFDSEILDRGISLFKMTEFLGIKVDISARDIIKAFKERNTNLLNAMISKLEKILD